MSTALPVVNISRRGAERIRAGHVWVYRSDVVEAGDVPPGAVVLVQEQDIYAKPRGSDRNLRPTRATQNIGDSAAHTGGRGRPPHPRTLGSAFYSSASEIALRMISRGPVEDINQLVRERIRAAIAYRERFVRDTNAYRVIFSEGDFLPGLVVDRYGDILSFQVLTQAMESPSMREIFIDELKLGLHPKVIVERTDARIRKLEQLPERGSRVIWQNTALGEDSSINPKSNEGEGNGHVGPDALVRAG